jgi:predicted HTH domain antitoxin
MDFFLGNRMSRENISVTIFMYPMRTRYRLQEQLTQELAFTLYERGLTSMGVARRYAGLNKWAFLEGLAQRGIKRHYEIEELNEDFDYANHGE